MAASLNDAWYSAGVDFGSVRSRILYVKFKFVRVKVCVVVVYGRTEDEDEERKILF